MLFSRRTLRASLGIVTAVSVTGLFGMSPAAAADLTAPNLAAASDSGSSSTDNITNAATLTFTVDGTAADEVIELYRGATLVDTETATGTSVTLTDATASDGTHTYKAVRTAPTTFESATLDVTVDRTAPTGAGPGTPDLQTASDTAGAGTTGTTTDNLTKDNSPTFDVDAGTTSDGTLTLYRGSTAVASGTAPLTDAGPVSDGANSYTARYVDAAGNMGTASAPLVVTIDTVATAPIPDLAAASDTGASNTDNITSTLIPDSDPRQYVTTLSFSFVREAGAVVTWERSTPAAPSTFATTGLSTPTGAGTTQTATHTISALSSVAPAAGNYSYRAKQIDPAGNDSGMSTPLVVTVDSVQPNTAVIDLDPATDTGLSNADNITSSATPPKFNITSDPSATITLYRNGSVVGSATADGAGASVITDSTSVPESNTYGYTAQVSDSSGNTNKLGYLPVFLDTAAPGAAGKLDLVAASDSGSDSSDDVTNDNTPTFMVTGAELFPSPALVELFYCPGAAACNATNRIGPIGSRLGNGEITSTVVIPDNVVGGITSWRFTTRQTDASGRVASVMGVDLGIAIDTTKLDPPSKPRLLSPDEVMAAEDAAPGVVAPTFAIDDASGRVQLLRDGVVVATRTASGRITDPGPLANGTYTYTALAIDTAGNISLPSEATVVTVNNAGGYWMVASDGGVFSFGDAGFLGGMGGEHLNAPILGIAPTPTREGYWLLATDGGVFSFGDAGFHGSTGDMKLNSPILGMVPTKTGQGYWLFAKDGGIFAFGDAEFYGAPASDNPTAPLVAMALSPDGKGYWLVDSKGKIYGYGSAASAGLTGIDGMNLNASIIDMAVTPSGKGLWLVASDGGIFAIGDAGFLGSMGATPLNKPIIGMEALPDGRGYWLFAGDGGVFNFGDAPLHGSLGDVVLNKPIVDMSGK